MNPELVAALRAACEKQPDPEAVKRGFADMLGARLGVPCEVRDLRIEAGVEKELP